ncbi:MAG: YjbH domain-containing protein [Pseudomonadota bacterium]
MAVERFESISARLSWSWQAGGRRRKALPFGTDQASMRQNRDPKPQLRQELERLPDNLLDESGDIDGSLDDTPFSPAQATDATEAEAETEAEGLFETGLSDNLLDYRQRADEPDTAYHARLLDEGIDPTSLSDRQISELDRFFFVEAAEAGSHELSHQLLALGVAASEETPAVETVTTALTHKGLPTLALTMQAQDLRALAAGRGSPEQVWAHTTTRPNQILPEDEIGTVFDRLSLDIRPTMDVDSFEARTSVISRASVVMAGEYVEQNSRIGADLRLNIADNLDRLDRDRSATLRPTRSNISQFADNTLWLDRAYYAQVGQPIAGLYLGIVGGFLEEQYAGVSNQLLYWRHDSKWAIGAELNQVFPRDPDRMLFVFDDARLTAELAGHYHLPGGTVLKGALTRYLGTDTGVRFDLTHPLDNGWQVEAYAAFSNADNLLVTQLAEFAETGGPDFGIRLTVPLGHLWDGIGGRNISITPSVIGKILGRDQAQSLDLPVTLYDWAAPAHMGNVLRSWPGLDWH